MDTTDTMYLMDAMVSVNVVPILIFLMQAISLF